MVSLLLTPFITLAPETVLPRLSLPLVAVSVVVRLAACVVCVTAAGRVTGALLSAAGAVFATVVPLVSLIGYQARKPDVPGSPRTCILP